MTTIDKIIQLLDKNNKTQKQLVDFISVSESTFSDWKSGKTQSYKKHIDRIALFLGVSIDYLLGTEQKENAPDISDEDIKFALFEGEKGISDAAFEEVKAFARFVKQREKEKYDNK